VNGARVLGLVDYGLDPGCHADLVVFDAPSEMDAIRLMSPRRAVIRHGQIVARTIPAQHTVRWNGAEETVDFLRRDAAGSP
jgi:cytosine deaminase